MDDKIYTRSIARGGLVFLKVAMADYLELNFETIGAPLRKRASGMRELAGEYSMENFEAVCWNSLWTTNIKP